MKGGGGPYYKARYGGRGRGAPSERNSSHKYTDTEQPAGLSGRPAPLDSVVGNKQDLERELRRIDGKQYGAYKDLKGNAQQCKQRINIQVDGISELSFCA